MSVILTARHLRVKFGAIVAVHDVSFDLGGGQLLGLVGPNGAGKTTLLRVLAGLQVPTRGTAHILGKPVLGENEIVRHHVGFAPDSAPAYEELTIHQFLRFIGRAYSLTSDTSNERIDFWLERLWLEGKRHTLIKNLSRGMRQRVTLARAFLPQPHVILLDEPLAGLDPAGRIELRGVLGMLRDQGCAMIVSSHILADLEQVATHIAIIERGSFLRWSTTDALFHHDEKQRVYRVTVVDGYTGTSEVLKVIEGVTNVSSNGRTVEFEYTAEEQKAAELLQSLIARDVPVVSFTVVKASLEEAYLRAGVRQVD